MGLIWTVVIGLVIGAIAKWLMPGKDGGGSSTMVLGDAGSFLDHMGGWSDGTAMVAGGMSVIGRHHPVGLPALLPVRLTSTRHAPRHQAAAGS